MRFECIFYSSIRQRTSVGTGQIFLHSGSGNAERCSNFHDGASILAKRENVIGQPREIRWWDFSIYFPVDIAVNSFVPAGAPFFNTIAENISSRFPAARETVCVWGSYRNKRRSLCLIPKNACCGTFNGLPCPDEAAGNFPPA